MTEIDPITTVPRVREFYKGRTVFVTGFTGFLGRCTVEKIIWSCPEVKRFYVLMRGRKDLSVEDRLKKVTDSDCFNRLRDRDPNFTEKIVAVSGDSQQPGLGLSTEDRERIVSEVSVIIHGAATVRFDEPLSTAIDINIEGTKSLLDLALTMPHLVVFTHISTAYTNSNRRYVNEKMYPPLADWKDTRHIRDKIDPYILNTVMNKVKGRSPNTYTFTKNVAEHMVYEYGDKLPIVILRPTIVSGAIEEPFPGWFHTMFGPIGMNLLYSTGFLRVLYCDPNGKMDVLPSDLFTKSATFLTSLRPCQRKESKPIYHLSTIEMTPLNHESRDLGRVSFERYPLKYILWTQTLTMTVNPFLYQFLLFFCQLLPALLIDLLLTLIGRKRFMFDSQRKGYLFTSVYSYFMNNTFIFDHTNLYHSEKFLRDDDRPDMHYAVVKEEINYQKLFDDFLIHIGRKFLKQKPEDHDRAIKLGKAVRAVDTVLKFGFCFYLAYFIYSRQIIPHLLVTTYNFIFNYS